MPWPWPFSSSSSASNKQRNDTPMPSSSSSSPSSTSSSPLPIPSAPPTTWDALLSPHTLIPAALMTTAALSGRYVYVNYLRRIRVAGAISPRFWRRRSLLGRVTSVGDGDGFRLFHTPGGRLAGWGWFPGRAIPRSVKDLKDNTVSIRLAGVDAPEMAHFGRPAQPGSQEAFEYLRSFIGGRRVRAYVHKRDQYERAVATVYVRRPLFFRRTDVSLELLRQGLATIYEGKTGAEFGGRDMEEKYRRMEEWAKGKKRGIWGRSHSGKKGWIPVALTRGDKGMDKMETPMEYKRRMAREGSEEPPG